MPTDLAVGGASCRGVWFLLVFLPIPRALLFGPVLLYSLRWEIGPAAIMSSCCLANLSASSSLLFSSISFNALSIACALSSDSLAASNMFLSLSWIFFSISSNLRIFSSIARNLSSTSSDVGKDVTTPSLFPLEELLSLFSLTTDVDSIIGCTLLFISMSRFDSFWNFFIQAVWELSISFFSFNLSTFFFAILFLAKH